MPDRRRRNRFARRLAVFGPAGIVVLTGFLAYGALHRTIASRELVQHTHDVLDASNRVLTALLDAETSTRGYVITHDTSYLAPAADTRQRTERGLADLRALTADNRAQQLRVDTLADRAMRRLRAADSIVAIERLGRTDLSRDAVRHAAGPGLMGDARRLVANIQAEEERLLVARRVAEKRSMELTTIIVIAGAVIAALLALFVNRSFDRALRDRRRALEETEAANNRLQENAIELEQQAEAAMAAATEAEQATESAQEALAAAEESERRAERLQAATEALTGALGIGDVANLIVDQALHALRADSGGLAVLDHEKNELTFMARRNIDVSVVGDHIPLDAPYPMATAAREARPVMLSAPDAIAREFPAIVTQHRIDRIQALGAFPLQINGRVTGVLLVRFQRAQPLDGADRAFLGALSRIAAEAFERARLFEAERAARQAAEAANRAKAAFLASMSHELRTPLQAALGFAQLVRSGVYGAVNEQQAEVLGRVERSQTHLARLIDDILDFARLEAGRVRIEPVPVPLTEVISELAPLIEPQAAKKKIELTLLPPDERLVVMADRHRLQQVLVNIVGNAIKFTPENGMIRVGAVRDGASATIFVRDTGKGIPADRLQAIFEPFVQVEDALTRTNSGAGLGLAISRDLTRAMGGDLKVESELGVGSTFSIILPLA
jgi:signal transduction histidine kinase/CHASE3 domain sensor protein